MIFAKQAFELKQEQLYLHLLHIYYVILQVARGATPTPSGCLTTCCPPTTSWSGPSWTSRTPSPSSSNSSCRNLLMWWESQQQQQPLFAQIVLDLKSLLIFTLIDLFWNLVHHQMNLERERIEIERYAVGINKYSSDVRAWSGKGQVVLPLRFMSEARWAFAMLTHTVIVFNFMKISLDLASCSSSWAWRNS